MNPCRPLASEPALLSGNIVQRMFVGARSPGPAGQGLGDGVGKCRRGRGHASHRRFPGQGERLA